MRSRSNCCTAPFLEQGEYKQRYYRPQDEFNINAGPSALFADATISTAEKDQRLTLGLVRKPQHAAYQDRMIAALVKRLTTALENRQSIGQGGRTEFRFPERDSIQRMRPGPRQPGR